MPLEQAGIQRHRVPAQQVLEVHVPQCTDTHLPVDQVADPGQDPERGGHLAAMLHDVAHHRRRCGRDRDDDLVDLVFFADIADPLVPSQHLLSLEPGPELRRVVVDEP
ncbi:MAG TPA: hypothetical protein DDX05_06095, partial [Deltaproteobacteria bacterium]|nr:hypothetical protein [Deltaproteobacteria bacterium]